VRYSTGISRSRAVDVILTLGVLVALLVWSHAATVQTGSTTAPDTLERQLEESLAKGANDRATEELSTLIVQSDLTADILLRAGIAFAQRELYVQASRAFARCVRAHPDVFEGHYNLALAELAQNHWTEALSAIEAAPHRSDVEDTARLYLRGKIESGLGQTKQAIQDLSKAFERDPREENFALDLGLVYLRSHNYQQGQQVFGRGADLNPHSSYLLLGLALAHYLGGNTKQTIEVSRRLLDFEPAFSPARILLGFALYLDGKLDQAQKTTAAGLGLPGPNPYLYYLDAAILAKQHSRDYARIFQDLAAAEKGIAVCPLCYVVSGKAHEGQGDWSAAASDFETALRITPDLSEAWYHLASAYDRFGRTSEAARARERLNQLRAGKEDRERQMLQNVILESIGEHESNSPR
jgi:tetratricopeptide (TPR) repeat protein